MVPNFTFKLHAATLKCIIITINCDSYVKCIIMHMLKHVLKIKDNHAKDET